MAIPIRLLWNLQISMREKLAVGVVFTVGLITMVFAIVRTVSLDSTTSGGQVSTEWLIFWGAIEGMVAIIVGCLPSFAVFIRGRVKRSRGYASYPTQNVSKRYQSGSDTEQQRSNTQTNLELHTMDIERASVGGESIRSLVADNSKRNVEIKRVWSQRWHRPEEEARGNGP